MAPESTSFMVFTNLCVVNSDNPRIQAAKAPTHGLIEMPEVTTKGHPTVQTI